MDVEKELKLIEPGYYLAKGAERKSPTGPNIEFTIHRGVAGHERQKILMNVESRFKFDDIRRKLNSKGWCIIRVCHSRKKIYGDQTLVTHYVNQVHPMEQ